LLHWQSHNRNQQSADAWARSTFWTFWRKFSDSLNEDELGVLLHIHACKIADLHPRLQCNSGWFNLGHSAGVNAIVMDLQKQGVF